MSITAKEYSSSAFFFSLLTILVPVATTAPTCISCKPAAVIAFTVVACSLTTTPADSSLIRFCSAAFNANISVSLAYIASFSAAFVFNCNNSASNNCFLASYMSLASAPDACNIANSRCVAAINSELTCFAAINARSASSGKIPKNSNTGLAASNKASNESLIN